MMPTDSSLGGVNAALADGRFEDVSRALNAMLAERGLPGIRQRDPSLTRTLKALKDLGLVFSVSSPPPRQG